MIYFDLSSAEWEALPNSVAAKLRAYVRYA
jgi:hypothetical protein